MLKYLILIVGVFCITAVHGFRGYHVAAIDKPTKFVKQIPEKISNLTTSIKNGIHDLYVGRPGNSAYEKDQKYTDIGDKIANQIKKLDTSKLFNNILNIKETNYVNNWGPNMKYIKTHDTQLSGLDKSHFKEGILGAETPKNGKTYINGTIVLTPIIITGNVSWTDPLPPKDESNANFTVPPPTAMEHAIEYHVNLRIMKGDIKVLSIKPDFEPMVFGKISCDDPNDISLSSHARGSCSEAMKFVEGKATSQIPHLLGKKMKAAIEKHVHI